MSRLDLPQPVEPMMAVVSPGFAVKLMCSSASLSAPGKRKLPSSNRTTPSHSFFSREGFAVAASGSWMEALVRQTSSIRSAATPARGSITATMASIRKDMTICMV